MKIMLVGTSPFEKQASGAQVYLMELAKELSKKHKISVFCGTIEEQEQAFTDIEENNIIFRIADCTRKKFSEQSFSDFFDKHKPDIVHIVTLMRFPNSFFEKILEKTENCLVELIDYLFLCPKGTFFDYKMQLCRSPGIKCIACLVAGGENTATAIGKAILKAPFFLQGKNRNIELLNRCSMLKANSAHTKKVFGDFGIKKGKIVVHKKGIIPQKQIKPKKLHKGKEIVFGFVGTLYPMKGPHILVQAFNEMPENCRLLVYGYGNQEYEKRLREGAKHPGISFRGAYKIESISRILQGIDVTVIPSVWEEPFGVAATNSLSLGVPVIASNTGGLKEIIQEGKNGYLFERNNPKCLLEKMLAIAENPAILKKLDKKSFSQKSIEEFAKETEQYYKKILDNSKSKITTALS